MVNIEDILKKRKWTGKELGIIELSDMAINFKQKTEGKDAALILSDDKFQRMIKSMDGVQKKIYNGYAAIHQWILQFFNAALAYEQQAQFRVLFLTSYLIDASASADTYNYIEKSPVIMTEKQYKDMKERKTQDPRFLKNGVAILKPGTFNESCIDSNGYYIGPEIRKETSNYGLETLFPGASKYAENVEEIKSSRDNLLNSYYFIMGYNIAIDMIANHYEVAALSTFKLNLANIAKMIDAFNTLVQVIHDRIESTWYEDEELKGRKLHVLKEFFSPVDYQSLSIPEKNISEVEKLLNNFQAFLGEELIAGLMFYRPREEGGTNG